MVSPAVVIVIRSESGKSFKERDTKVLSPMTLSNRMFSTRATDVGESMCYGLPNPLMLVTL